MAWTNTTTTTTADAFEPSIWAAEIEPYAESNLVAEGIVTHFPFTQGGQVLYLPKMGQISCNAAITDGTDVTLTANTETSVTITPAGREAAVFIPWTVMATTMADTIPAYQREIGRSIRTDRDYRMLTQVASLTTNTVGGAANHVDKAVFLEANGLIRSADASPPYNAVFHTDEFQYFFAIAEFVDASKSGSTDRIERGLGGFLIGTSIYFSSNVYASGGVNYNFVGGARCLAYAAKVGLTIEINQIPEKGNGTLILGKYMDETAILNDAYGVQYQTQAA